MNLTPGTRLGPYEVASRIGAGGMGEVYRARDTKLNRDVAIKVLPELFATDPDRLARFTREAQTLAALNHPNIAQIYGVIDHPAALVMEYADGDELSAIIARGPLPVADALAIARQIGDALEAAHEQGIVHRDLKPANIKVKADGTVKVLDFGLAKAMDPVSSAGPEGPAYNAVNSPTFTAQYTQMGVVLGTAAYMAPEQARGRAVDKRADIWAFGVVVFEMLTGRQTFAGDTISEVMASVMKDDPDWTRLPPALPPQLLRLLRRCLVKDPKQRLRDIGDARLLLDDTEALAPALVDTRSRPRRRALAVTAALAVIAAALVTGGAAVRFWWPAGSAAASLAGSPHLHLLVNDPDEITTPDLAPLAVSPDGTRVAYVAGHAGQSRLFVRTLADPEARALAGTEGATTPFFSPDGQWIAFFADLKLKKAAIGGTAVQVLCDSANQRGGSWGADGQIYFAPTNISGLMKVSENGGTPVSVTQLNRQSGEISHRWPLVLPEANTLLFTIWTGPGPDERAIVRQSLLTGDRQMLVRGGDRARYTDGYLVYVRLDNLFAIPWRPADANTATTAPLALSETARVENEGAGAYDFSPTGTFAALAGSASRYRQRLVWIDRAGRIDPLPAPERDYESVWISPDGTRALAQIREGAMGLWIYDFARHTLTPLAANDGSSQGGTWTPDGAHVVYRGTRGGTRDLYWRAADGTGTETRLVTMDGSLTPDSVSPDGMRLIFHTQGGKSGRGQLFTIRLDGPFPASPQLLEDNGAISGQLSPDGKWLAYAAPVSDRYEIYVGAFPGRGPRTQISTEGGLEPLWARNGRALFYQSGDRLMEVAVSTTPAFAAGEPRLVVQGRFRTGPNSKTAFDVAADGRFLRVQQVEPERPLNRLDIVLNWIAKLDAAVHK
jgi:serine/threonine-protein kinase